MVNDSVDMPEHVSKCLQLAILLEVSAYPKPGNVHRTSNFKKTRYEHFLASAVSVGPYFKCGAQKGFEARKNGTELANISTGRIIKDAVTDIMTWQRGGNTLLGSIILLSPMAAAAGLTLTENTRFSINRFRSDLKSVVESTTAEDAVNVYDAINAAHPGGLGRAPQLDVTDAQSKKKILEMDTSLYEVFKISSSWDSISAEWVNNYHITFDVGYPFFKLQLKQTNDVNTAIVHTYLKILSDVPDTLIIRKAGLRKARWASRQAKQALEAGGLTTRNGRDSVLELDRRLHDSDHKLNPGTTADITSASIAIAVLGGYRP
jgi:triphosphoribosyl-dephospho-CoA synthase